MKLAILLIFIFNLLCLSFSDNNHNNTIKLNNTNKYIDVSIGNYVEIMIINNKLTFNFRDGRYYQQSIIPNNSINVLFIYNHTNNDFPKIYVASYQSPIRYENGVNISSFYKYYTMTVDFDNNNKWTYSKLYFNNMELQFNLVCQNMYQGTCKDPFNINFL